MDTREKQQARDQETGRYTFDGDLSRLCVCGHPLGLHCAGAPHDCFGPEGRSDSACEAKCKKYRPMKRAGKYVIDEAYRAKYPQKVS
jgi:hypothetical protein